ncbi:hypothetical protein ACP70R_033841 [Stipagrostis hirtigluma subsp. patula]
MAPDEAALPPANRRQPHRHAPRATIRRPNASIRGSVGPTLAAAFNWSHPRGDATMDNRPASCCCPYHHGSPPPLHLLAHPLPKFDAVEALLAPTPLAREVILPAALFSHLQFAPIRGLVLKNSSLFPALEILGSSHSVPRIRDLAFIHIPLDPDNNRNSGISRQAEYRLIAALIKHRSSMPNGQPKWLLSFVPDHPMLNFMLTEYIPYLLMSERSASTADHREERRARWQMRQFVGAAGPDSQTLSKSLSYRVFELTNVLKGAFIPSADNNRLYQNFIAGIAVSVCLYFCSLILLKIPVA